MKKIVGMSMVFLLLMFSAMPAYAYASDLVATSGFVPQYKAIMQMSAGLSIDSWGKTTCSGSVSPQSDSYTSYLTVTLQKYTSSGWSDIKSWDVSEEGCWEPILKGIIMLAKVHIEYALLPVYMILLVNY